MRALSVDPQSFRSAIGSFASGATVITTARGGTPFGTTASALTSLCLEPPMLLVCMNRGSVTREAVLQAGRFAINILREGHEELAVRFARSDGEKFAGVRRTELDGLPLLDEALAHFTCDVERAVNAGTHTVLLAQVEKAAADDGRPLAYFRGRFGMLAIAEETA